MRARDTAVLGAVVVSLASCNGDTAQLRRQFEATHLATALRADFASAAEASHRAVMAETDEASASAAHEAEAALARVTADAARLDAHLQSLGYQAETIELQTFTRAFMKYREVDEEVLGLAVENTNLKAQRLLNGPAAAAFETFRTALQTAARSARPESRCAVDASMAHAVGSLLEIQVIAGRHIVAADDAAMTKMEAVMTSLAADARQQLHGLRATLPRSAAPSLADAAAALERFDAVDAEIVALSRKNTNVRSLALVLGKQRTLTAECDNSLGALAGALGGHELRGTR